MMLAFLIMTTAFTQTYDVYFYDRRPLYFVDHKGKATGLIVDKFIALAKNTKFKYRLVEVPAKRQFVEIEKNEKAVCGLGWFKTSEREKNGRFSKPIYKSRPMVVISSKGKLSEKTKTIKDFMAKADLVYLKKSGFSYGEKIDQIENELKPKTDEVSVSIENLVDMVAYRDKYYAVVEAFEIDYLLSRDPSLKDRIQLNSIEEALEGNTRYLYCSKKVSQELLDSIREFSF